jgi:hypothetical protein
MEVMFVIKINILVDLIGHPGNYLIINDKYLIYHLLFTREWNHLGYLIQVDKGWMDFP